MTAQQFPLWYRGGKWPDAAGSCAPHGTSLDDGVTRAIAAFEHDGVVMFPGDAVYGFYGNALSENAIEAVYDIKHRDRSKPFALCTTAEQVDRWAVVGCREWALIRHFWPGGLGLLLPKSKNLPAHFSPTVDTVVVMTATNYVAAGILSRVSHPVFATTLNYSGEPEVRTKSDAAHFLDRTALLIGDDDVFTYGKPTTIVDCTATTPTVLRESAIPFAEIETFIDGLRL